MAGWICSDSVLAPADGSLFGAGIAGALDDEAVVFDSESVGAGDLIPQLDDFFAGKFDQLSAFGAVQVVVFGIAVVQFVHASAIEFEAVEESCVYEFLEGSIDGRPRDIVIRASRGKLLDQQIGVEMFVSVEDLIEQKLFLRRVSQPTALEEFLVALQGGHRDLDRLEWLVWGFRMVWHVRGSLRLYTPWTAITITGRCKLTREGRG
jgi:hypothetical protein